MKKTIKTLAIICAVAILAMCGAGCGKEPKVQNAEVSNFTYWTVMDGNTSAANITDYNEMLLFRELEKKSGIHIDFLHPVQGSTGNEAFIAVLTGNDKPDMMEYNWANYTGGPQQAIDDGVIVCLDEYLEEYAPNYYDYMEGEKAKANNNLYKLQSTTHIGQHYGFNNLNIGDTRIFSGLMVRGDMLEKWGMDIPVTIDDWTAIFAKAKSEGFSKPLTGVNFDFSFTGSTGFFNTAFGVGKYYYVEDGKVVYAPFQDGYKEYVAQLTEWNKAGYIDTGFVTNDATKVEGYIANNISVAASGSIGGTMGKIVPAMRAENPDFTLVACPLPVAKEGDVPEYRSMSGEATGLAIGISTTCASYETAISWCDYLYSEEGSILRNFGVEGDTYTVEEIDGEKHFVYTEKITKPELSDVNTISEAMYKYFLPANHPGLNQHPDYLNGYYDLEEQKEAMAVWNADIEKARVHFLPNLDFTDEESEQKTDILEVLDTELDKAISEIILGRTSIDEFDAIVDKAWNDGFNKVLDIYQAAYDRYISKLDN